MKGSLGPYKFEMDCDPDLGGRCDWESPPPAGTKILAKFVDYRWTTSWIVHTVVGISPEGEVIYADGLGREQADFPTELKMPEGEAVTVG